MNNVKTGITGAKATSWWLSLTDLKNKGEIMPNPEYPKHPEIYDMCMERAKRNAGDYFRVTAMLHLSDAVERGTISPMEAYDALNAAYFPIVLEIRESRYSHLLK